MKYENKKKTRTKIKAYLPLYFMLLPGCIYMLINNYIPMAGLLLAFKRINYALGLWKSPWVKFDNFKYLFLTNDAAIMFRNTICYNIAFILLGNIMAIFVAVLLDLIAKKGRKKVYQTMILIPYMISMVIVSYIVFAFLSNQNGFINKSILPALGREGISWYTNAGYWPFILTLVFLWKSFGYSSILYYATIIGIDKSYYEAAMVDGATLWQQIKYIALPGLKPTIIILVLLQIGRICYSDFGLFYQVPMNSGLLYSTTTTIDTYVYRGLLTLNDLGRSTAAGFLQSFLGFAMVITANWVVRKLEKDNALF
jgi:putative aldouronate transport system permease protein